MTEKELKRLGRRELIEIIASMKKTELENQKRLAKADEQLASRTIYISNAGSIAEAALALNGVFESAQAAADTYLQSVRASNAQIEERIAQAEAKSRRLLLDAEQLANARLEEADAQCAQKLAEADAQIRAKWERFEANVRSYLRSHSELAEYLQEKPEKEAT